jgi:hypothetical protein
MGQGASKTVSKYAENVVKKAAERKPPAGPAPPASKTPATQAANPGSFATQAANPGSFLRGEGIAQEDIRDIGQELFLQHMHKVDDKAKERGPQEMPPDLLKFIQDVGPAKQTVDKDFTTPRLLEKENEEELKKVESTRHMVRERKRMPLMGEDENFTTERNTNFSDRPEESSKDFGTSNLQLYDILARKSKEGDMDAAVNNFYNKIMPEQDGWTDQERGEHRQMLKQALQAVDLPVLREDSEGNIIGLYPDHVPGPEVKSMQPIPTTKVKLVLEDIVDRNLSGDAKPKERLERRRQERKGSIQSE